MLAAWRHGQRGIAARLVISAVREGLVGGAVRGGALVLNGDADGLPLRSMGALALPRADLFAPRPAWLEDPLAAWARIAARSPASRSPSTSSPRDRRARGAPGSGWFVTAAKRPSRLNASHEPPRTSSRPPTRSGANAKGARAGRSHSSSRLAAIATGTPAS